MAAAHSHTQKHTHTHCGKFCSWCLLAYDCRKNKLCFTLSDLRDEAASIPVALVPLIKALQTGNCSRIARIPPSSDGAGGLLLCKVSTLPVSLMGPHWLAASRLHVCPYTFSSKLLLYTGWEGFFPSLPFLSCDVTRPGCQILHPAHILQTERCVASFLTSQAMSCHVFLPLFLTSMLLACLSCVLSRYGGEWMIDKSMVSSSQHRLSLVKARKLHVEKCSVSHLKEHGWTLK